MVQDLYYAISNMEQKLERSEGRFVDKMQTLVKEVRRLHERSQIDNRSEEISKRLAIMLHDRKYKKLRASIKRIISDMIDEKWTSTAAFAVEEYYVIFSFRENVISVIDNEVEYPNLVLDELDINDSRMRPLNKSTISVEVEKRKGQYDRLVKKLEELKELKTNRKRNYYSILNYLLHAKKYVHHDLLLSDPIFKFVKSFTKHSKRDYSKSKFLDGIKKKTGYDLLEKELTSLILAYTFIGK